MNKMYEYLKNHAYISYYKKSTYEFELSEERAECIVNKYNSLTDELQQENKRLNGAIQTYDILLKANIEENEILKEDIKKLQKELNEENLQCSKNAIEINDLKENNKELKDNWTKLKKDLELVVDYGLGDESSKWDKIYGEYAKSTLKFMQELEQGSDSNE